jgi:hypothetical protein
MDNYTELFNEIEAYKNQTELKQKYLNFIQNESNALKERWKMFKHAPYEFKNHQKWIVHFEAESLLPSGEIVWFDDFYKDRYSTVNMIDIVDSMKELPENYSKEVVEAFKKEILQKNLESFIYDW